MSLSRKCTFGALSALSALPILLIKIVLSPITAAAAPKPVAPAKSQPAADKAAPAPAVDRHLSRGEVIARTALGFRGMRYRFGGNGSRGVDCSGLAMAVCRKWGLLLPRSSSAQFQQGKPVPKKELEAGDLVFFRNTYKRGISHVGIYIGDDKMVHAANSRQGVIVSSLSEAYFAHHFAGARRLALETAPLQPKPNPAAIVPDWLKVLTNIHVSAN